MVMGRARWREKKQGILRWAREKSALEGLLWTCFQQVRRNSVYTVLVVPLEDKKAVVGRRFGRDRHLSPSEAVVLYDVTDTSFPKGSDGCKREAWREFLRGRLPGPASLLLRSGHQ